MISGLMRLMLQFSLEMGNGLFNILAHWVVWFLTRPKEVGDRSTQVVVVLLEIKDHIKSLYGLVLANVILWSFTHQYKGIIFFDCQPPLGYRQDHPNR